MPTDWFRTPDWDAVARDDFERRLARARPYNRPQYLKIKAIALREDGQTDASRAMLHRALDDPNIYNFEAACVTEPSVTSAARPATETRPRLGIDTFSQPRPP